MESNFRERKEYKMVLQRERERERERKREEYIGPGK